ncbi:MAG: TIGR01212 family radical SAM protein [Lachnospiraceae bacterium]|nr:TIGR01212 family radical SAM protein [Lachnospiraceae bacterium]
MRPYFYSADEYLKETFGKKMFRLSLDGDTTCPNRDGTAGFGGCIFCSASGSGDFAAKRTTSVHAQLEAAKLQVKNKLPKNGAPYGYVAYFQSFTSTYAPVDYLEPLFTEALNHPEVEGLFIGTRPDCLPAPVLDLLTRLSQKKPVYIELGLQTAKTESIAYINRCYSNSVFEEAVAALHARGIPVIVHCILGLPYETLEDMQHTIDYICSFPVHGIKLQLLHILKGTGLAKDYDALCKNQAFACMERDSYINTVLSLLERIPPHIVIYRLTGDGPRNLLLAPLWSTDKKRIQNDLRMELKARNIIQGGKIPLCNLNH